MIDAHCHLNFKAFTDDYDQIITDAQNAGVHTIINVGTQITSSKSAVNLARNYQNLYAVIGIHPHHADKVIPYPPEEQNDTKISSKTWIEQLEKLADNPKVIGIGEIGIDYYSYQQNGIVEPRKQEEVFITQLELAHQLNLPVQTHTRTEKARKETLRILKEHKHLLHPIPGMFHCFAGSRESLNEALSLGFYLGFDGNTLYQGIPQGELLPLPELVKEAPLDRIVIETDSPYLSPPPHRGTRNVPAYAIITGQYIATLKDIPFKALVEQTDKNVYTIFTKLKKQI
jgi:TatD DNase family protein